MNEKNLNVGDTITYDEQNYKVIENRIKTGKNKKKAVSIITIVSLITMVAVYLLYVFALNIMGIDSQGFSFGFGELAIFFVALCVSFTVFIVAHEFVHYLTYRYAGKTPKDKLKFGVVLKMGMAYCISLVPNTVRASRLSLMMPFYVLVIPCIILAIALQSWFLIFLAALFASGSAGDFWYMWTLRKDSKDKYIIESMPENDGYEIGYLLLEKLD